MAPFFHLGKLMASLLLLILLAVGSAVSSDAGADGDRAALLAFKAPLSDPGGVLGGNWTAGAAPYCAWLGVSCAARRHRARVTSLELPGVRLAGELAPELGAMSFLFSLNLSGAGLSGPIPGDLGLLRRLVSLDLSGNRLSGVVPPALGGLGMLELLDLRSNNLTGAIPAELGDLRSIAWVDLSRNELNGQIPAAMFNATSQMVFFNLAYNSLVGSIPSTMSSSFLPNLEVMALSANQLSGPIPEALFNMSNLQKMYMSNNNLSGVVPDGGGGGNGSFSLPMLRVVTLRNNLLAGAVPRGFAACKRLRSLVLAYNQFTGGIPPWLAAMPELEAVSLGGNGLSGEIPAGLGNLTGLVTLDFTTSNLSGRIPPELGRLARLQWLNLEMNSLTGTIPTSIRNLSMISMLDISFNLLTGPMPRSIFGDAIAELYIDENNLSGELDFMADLSGCQSLKYLVMNSNRFAGGIPRGSMSNLSSLEIFRAFENRITGNLPDMPANGSNGGGGVLFIDLRSNRFTGPIPTSLVAATTSSLQLLDLSGNELSGTIPAQIGQLQSLSGFAIANNKIHGGIPSTIGNLTRLQILELSNNRLRSDVPDELWRIQSIVKIALSHNFLTGDLPEQAGDSLRAATLIDLSSNRFHGGIPSSWGELRSLAYLNLSANKLRGPIPDAIGKLGSVETMDLSSNSLSGAIPKSLANLTYLAVLDLSRNRLDGEVPEGGVFLNITGGALAGNGALCGGPVRLGLPRCPSHGGVELRRSERSKLLRSLLPGIVAAGVVASCLFMAVVRARRSRKPAGPPPVAAGSGGANGCRPVVTYHELARATGNFDRGRLIGEGSFGQVFRGELDDGQVVAVKVLRMELERARRSFDDECRALRMARHRNLVRILTTCSNLDFKALVLQYMPNGSLDEWLFSGGRRRGLRLAERLGVMLDVAAAVAYLHHQHHEVVLHCDLKPSNVLLDDDMAARVADFGVARLLLGDDASMVSATMPGTVGYMAPEYGSTGKASRKSDVFSYGIMLLEVFTGKKPTDAMFAGELSLRRWVAQAFPSRLADVVDPRIFLDDDDDVEAGRRRRRRSFDSRGDDASSWSTMAGRCLEDVMGLGLQCSRESPEERISMVDAAVKLEQIRTRFSSGSELASS